MRDIARIGLACSVLALVTPGARAQAPRGSERLSEPAIAESLAVLKDLHATVQKHYKDAPAWFHQGMIAWSLYERCRHEPPARGLDCTRPRLLADTSFLIATEIDTANAHYALTLSRYLLASEGNYRRDSPYLDRLFHTTLERTKASGDEAAYAEALIGVGSLHWNRYDETAHRVFESDFTGHVRAVASGLTADSTRRARAANPDDTSRTPTITRETVRQARKNLDAPLIDQIYGFTGELDYAQSEYLFREALATAPTSLHAYRTLGLLLGDRNRWSEIAALGRARIQAVPRDGWAWMTLGMTSVRRGNSKAARALFDSALSYLSKEDVHSLDRLERVLGSTDRSRYDALTPDGKAAFERLFWLASDPLWTHEGDETRTEFLARVAYAELMWSSNDMTLHGVDSDRGMIYIRYGPPDRIYSDRGHGTDHTLRQLGITEPFGEPGVRECGIYRVRSLWDYGWLDWSYDFVQCKFIFDRLPHYKTLTFAEDTLIRGGPGASWDNLISGRIDSIPARLARFRGEQDSIDVYVATLPPIAAVAKAAEVVGPVRTDFWLMTTETARVAHDSLVPSTPGVRAFTHRLAPGAYFFRTEATAQASLVAGRASGAFIAGDDPRSGFTARGFGLSDVLVANRAEPRGNVASRWTDLAIEPHFGPLARNSNVAVVWETYDLTNTNGTARYAVSIVLRNLRPAPTLGSAMAARIVGGIAGAVGIERKQAQDRVEFKYERAVPHKGALVDHMNISLGNTPAGSYILAIAVTDLATGKTSGRSELVSIVAPAPTRR
jgi:GWxTD domain-containing protein